MEFRHSISLLGANLTLVYRVLTFFLIVLIIVSAVMVGILNPLLSDLSREIADDGSTLFKMLENGVFSTLNFFINKVNVYLNENPSYFKAAVLYLCLTYLLLKFLICLAMTPATKIIYDKMKTGYAASFFGSLISHFKVSILYAFFAGVLLGAVDLGLFFLWGLLLKGLFPYVNIVSVGISGFILILVLAARMSLFSQLLPTAMDGEKNFLKIIKNGFFNSLKVFKTDYPIKVSIILALFTVTLTTLIPTFGIFPSVFSALSVVVFCSSSLTCAFNYKKQRYYLDGGYTVFEPKQ